MHHIISSSLLILLLSSLSSARTCTFDYECGNVPYAFCAGGESDCSQTVEGFAVTTTPSGGGSVYYAQVCRTDGQFENYTFKRVPLSGGVPVDIYSRMVIPAPANPNRIFGIIDSFLFFDILRRSPGVSISTIDVTKPDKELFVYTDTYPQAAGIELDVHSNTPAAYVCDYIPNTGTFTINKFPLLPKEGFVAMTKNLYALPQNFRCRRLARYSDVDLFFTTEEYNYGSTDYIWTKFYRGTILCSNCSIPNSFFTVHEVVKDFKVSGEYLFYGTTSGLFRVNLDGTGNVKLSREVEMATAIEIVNGKVIYNNGKDIISVDFQGNNFVLLSWNEEGACTCRPGFTGSNCADCNGQVQWPNTYYTQRPSCVSYGADGRPASCFADYHCGNPPYTWCLSNKCECWNANFTGARCDVCDPPRQVTWDAYGYPKCA